MWNGLGITHPSPRSNLKTQLLLQFCFRFNLIEPNDGHYCLSGELESSSELITLEDHFLNSPFVDAVIAIFDSKLLDGAPWDILAK